MHPFYADMWDFIGAIIPFALGAYFLIWLIVFPWPLWSRISKRTCNLMRKGIG